MEKLNDNNPLISVVMLAYNHEKYIAQAIESILMQKTKFKIEIIIAEDCSTDETRNITLAYYEKYPEIIKLILQKKNVGMIENVRTAIEACRGKYIAYLEGDDYWIDKNKIEKQVQFLEKEKEYVGTFHNIKTVDENENEFLFLNNIYCNMKEHDYTYNDALEFKFEGQTASKIHVNFFKDWENSMLREFCECKLNGDVKITILQGMYGKVKVFNDVMVVHRKIVSHGDSWSARNHGKNNSYKEYCNYIEYADFLKKYYNADAHIEMGLKNLIMSAIVFYVKSRTKENKEILRAILKKSGLNRYQIFKLVFEKIENKVLRMLKVV